MASNGVPPLPQYIVTFLLLHTVPYMPDPNLCGCKRTIAGVYIQYMEVGLLNGNRINYLCCIIYGPIMHRGLSNGGDAVQNLIRKACLLKETQNKLIISMSGEKAIAL